MSKRRERDTSISEETLERARQQARTTGRSRAERRASTGTTSTGYSSRRASLEPGRPRKIKREVHELSAAEVEERLANPTKIVTEAELRQQYTYVLLDLRNMAMLAVALFVLLIVIALVFV